MEPECSSSMCAGAGHGVELSDRVAIVTGGSRGIGRAIALDLAAAGADVVIAARSPDAAPQALGADWASAPTSALVEAMGRRCRSVSADLAVDADLERVLATTLAEFGRLDFLVNNAAQFETVPILDPDVDTFDRMWRVNTRAPYRLTKLAVPHIIDVGGGAVINISSGAAWLPSSHPSAPPPIHRGPEYGMTKAALDRFTAGVARDLIPHRVGVVGIWVRYTATESNLRTSFPGLAVDDALPMSVTSRAVALICSDPMRFTGQIREPGEFSQFDVDPVPSPRPAYRERTNMSRKLPTDIVVEPTGATLGAFVHGVDLRNLSDDDFSVIEDAFHEHAVLIFPNQELESADQKAFARRFGELEVHSDSDEPSYITNVQADGDPLDPATHQMRLQQGTQNWHTDSSYLPVSAKASTLSAKVVTTTGGGTEWADMRAAFDELDDDTKAEVVTMRAHHSLFHSLSLIGYRPDTTAGLVGLEGRGAPLRPLVKVHPVTRRPALFIGQHACAIEGMDPGESQRFLARLMEHACQPPRTYEHRWSVGDVVIWDNRCVLHRARPYDPSEPRKLEHVRIAGDPATESASLSSSVM